MGRGGIRTRALSAALAAAALLALSVPAGLAASASLPDKPGGEQLLGADAVRPRTAHALEAAPGRTAAGATVGSAVSAAATGTTTAARNASTTVGATSVTLSATVTAADGGAVNEGTVTLAVTSGATAIGTATTGAVSGGAASVSYALPSGTSVGTYTITASYSGSAAFAASSGTATLTIAPGFSAGAASSGDGTSSHQVMVTSSGGQECRTTTFENGGQNAQIHPENGFLIPNSNARFPGWLTLTSGNYSNNPSPPTIAYWFDGTTQKDITFDQAVRSVSFSYAAFIASSAKAFDAGGNLVASASMPQNAFGTANTWAPITLSASTNVIKKVTIVGDSDQTGIDDLRSCRDTLVVNVAGRTATFGDASVVLDATVTFEGTAVNEGSVTFTVTGSPTIGIATTVAVTNGAATVTYALPSGTNAGTYTINASYSGTANVPAGSGTGVLTINKKATTTDIPQTSISAFVGQTITLTANVAGSPVDEGIVTFTIASSAPTQTTPVTNYGAFTANVVNGQASTTVTLTSPPLTQPIGPGTYIISASYSGLNHLSSSDTATLTLQFGVAGTLTCGGTAQAGTVRFYSGDTLVLTVTAAADGSFTANLNPGTYNFTFAGLDGRICGGGTVTISGNGAATQIINQLVDLKNHSWRTAYTITPSPEAAPFCLNARIGRASEHKFLIDQSLWFRFLAGRGSVIRVEVTSAGTPVNAAIYRDPTKLFNTPTTPSQLQLINAEFSDGDFSDGEFSDGEFSDGEFSDGEFSDGDFSDGEFSDGEFSDGEFSDGEFSDGDFSDGDFSDGEFSDGDFSDDQASFGEQIFADANTSLLRRARIAILARAGLAKETFTKIFWGDDQYIYVKVFGDGVSLTEQVQLTVTVCPGSCEGTSDPTAAEGGWTILHGDATAQNKTIVLTDLVEQLQVADLATALANPDVKRFLQAVATFLGLPENAPSLHVDVSTAPRVQFAKTQAKQRFGCAWAQNLWMQEAKKAISAHRTPGFMFAVLVGDGGVLPFEQFFDRSGLAPVRRYLPRPPYVGNSPDQGALQNNMFLSQDGYVSQRSIRFGDFEVPLVDANVAVGRVLGERARTPGDTDGLNVARGLFEAYPAATGGFVQQTGTPGIATYGRQDDGGQAVRKALEASLGANTVTHLRHPGGPTEGFNFATGQGCAIGTVGCTSPWDVEQFRSFMDQPRWFRVVGVHGRDFDALMSDYRTRFFASEIANSPLDLTNTLNLWLACNVGRSVGNAFAIEGLTQGPDFPESYARKRGVLIAATSYTYFETELVEYQERFNVEFAKQLTRGVASWGKAFYAAKREYLMRTFQMSGLHQKQALMLTYFGLPHLMSNVPAVASSSPASIVTSPPTGYSATLSSDAVLGLRTAQVTVPFTLSQQSVPFRDAETGAFLTPDAFFWTGRDGVVTDATMPILPLQAENATLTETGVRIPLRGTALRAGTLTMQNGVRIKTSAALYEHMTVHSTFYSDVLWPIVPWRVNYFDALARPEGDTFVLFTPVQYMSVPSGSQTGKVNLFSGMTVRLYYSDNTSAAALLAPPAIMDVSAPLIDAATNTVEFRVRINTDPAAPVQEAWITWFDVNGTSIQPVDLTFDAASGLWKAQKPFGATSLANVRFGVWAVNAKGLVGRDLNNGRYSVPNQSAPTATAPKTSTLTTIVSKQPDPGTYRGEVTIVGELKTAAGTPIQGATLEFQLGPARRSAATGADGRASATLKLLMPPATYTASVSFLETSTHLGSSAETAYTVNKRATVLTLETGPACSGSYAALLKEAGVGGHALEEEAVLFEVIGAGGTHRAIELTRFDGRAFLSHIPLPPGDYFVRAYFAGTIPIGGGQTITVNHPRYVSSDSGAPSLPNLTIVVSTVTIAYTGEMVEAVGSPLTFAVAVQEPVAASLLRDALVRYTVTRDGAVVRVVTAAKGTAGNWAAVLSDLSVGVYGVRGQMIGECTLSNQVEVLVAVYDPSSGFVTGGGWINSPAGAYVADPSLTGRANFGFVAKYLPGATVPSGSTEFQFKVANLNFKSTEYEWLVVSGARAQFKGTGTINGSGSYGFILTATDGQVPGGGGVDKFRIKIWDKATGNVVYDNQVGAGDDAEPSTALAGGSIVIHTK